MKKILLILFAFISVNASAQYVWSSYYGNVSSFSENDQFLVEQSDSTRYVTYGQLVDFILQKYDSASFAQLNAAKLYILGDWINSIESTLTDDDNAVPTSGGVLDLFNFSNAELIPFANALGTGFEYDTVFYYEPSGRTFYSGYRIKVRGIQGGTDGVADASYSAIQFMDNDEDIIADIETLSSNGNLRIGTRVSGGAIQFIDPVTITAGTLTLPFGPSVNNIQTTIGDSDVAVPTSGAVVDYVAANGSGDFSYSDTTSGPLVTDYQLDTAKINLRSEIATSIGDLAYADTVSGTGFIETQYRVDTAKTNIRSEIDAIVTSGSTAGSGIEFVGDSINLNGELTQATDLTWDGNSHIFRIKTKSGVGSNSRRIQADTNEGLLLEYYSNNNYSGDYGSVHAGSSTTAHPGMTYKPDTSSTTRYLTIRDSGIVTNHSVYFTEDSIYFQSQDIGAEWGYVRIDPNTGAMVLDTLITSAGAMLTEKLPRPGKLLSDRKDGEIKWPSIIKDGKVIWTYGIEPDQGRINTAHMGMIEANLRYTYRNTVKANISLGLNFAALIFVVVFLIWMYRKVY